MPADATPPPMSELATALLREERARNVAPAAAKAAAFDRITAKIAAGPAGHGGGPAAGDGRGPAAGGGGGAPSATGGTLAKAAAGGPLVKLGAVLAIGAVGAALGAGITATALRPHQTPVALVQSPPVPTSVPTGLAPPSASASRVFEPASAEAPLGEPATSSDERRVRPEASAQGARVRSSPPAVTPAGRTHDAPPRTGSGDGSSVGWTPYDEDTTTAPAPAAQPAPARERLVLDEARTALARRDYAGATAACQKHEREFPSGQLTAEREAILIRALAAQGRTAEAIERRDRFRRTYPNSVLLLVVDRALAPEK